MAVSRSPRSRPVDNGTTEVVSLHNPARDLRRLHRRACELLADEQEGAAADAVLVVITLALDACKYGLPPRIVRLRRAAGRSLRVEVEDGLTTPVEPEPDDYTQLLLDQLTTQHGVDYHDEARTIWAVVSLSSIPVPRAS